MARAIREILNEGNPNKLGDANRQLQMGEAIALVPRTVRGAVVANVLVLPEGAKCAAVLSAYAVAGTATGQLAPDVAGAAPAAGEAAPNAAGDVAFNGTDAVTFAEVQYLAFEGGIIDEIIVVDGGGSEQGSLLGLRGAAVILEVESLAGGATGIFAAAERGTTPGAGEAAIADDPTLIEFAAADAVTSARVKYIAQPGIGDGTRVSVSESLDALDKEY